MIRPGGTLGVLGGGQLGRMFTAEARRMGYRVIVVDPDPEAPAAQLADRHLARPWTDPEALDELASCCDAVTTEFENVPSDAMRALAAHVPVRPSGDAVAVTQDRISEKAFLNEAGVVTAAWAALRTTGEAQAAWDAIGGGPAILKTARLGYDGKGQVAVATLDEVRAGFRQLGEVTCILERRVALEREISVLVARAADGTTATWPIGENVHVNGILHTTVVPAAIPVTLAEHAARTATRVAEALGYVGVLAVECFVTTDGTLLVNELAPRPHNSGHWTLDASATSQFEQQVRITAGMPLGETALLEPIAMANLLGDLWPADGVPAWERALAVPGVRLHLYGKREARPGRKMGHLTASGPDAATALARVTTAWDALHD
ncbi:MAG TPA: 5-(carboxyamino)imidazole ribonucleotide synthase [Gemmatimonadales bacterium]|nr:5-(carboxyamino)imidazole ribonucleotide synthase [Gemmatimonadales bacterium]